MAIITTETINDKLVQREILSDVLVEAQKIGNLDNPAIVKTLSLNGMHGSIPLMDKITISEDVKELENTGFQSAEFGKFEFDMKKDRIKLAISDEAQLENAVANAFDLQKMAAAQSIASSFDRQIANALVSSPQLMSEEAIDITKSNIFKLISNAIGKIAPYKLTAMAMPTETFYQILSCIELRGANCVQNADGTISIPAFPNIPAILSDNIPISKNTSGTILFVSNEVPAAIKVNGAIKTRVYDDESVGATIFQSDIFRCVKSCVRVVSGNKNKGVVAASITW